MPAMIWSNGSVTAVSLNCSIWRVSGSNWSAFSSSMISACFWRFSSSVDMPAIESDAGVMRSCDWPRRPAIWESYTPRMSEPAPARRRSLREADRSSICPAILARVSEVASRSSAPALAIASWRRFCAISFAKIWSSISDRPAMLALAK